MKKTVLFLMNGFGIEQLDSYNIYNAKLMPNLDNYTKTHLFTSITTPTYNLVSGYRYFSTNSKYPLSCSLIDNYIDKLETNKNITFYLNSIRPEGKIHLFLSLENEKSLEHLRVFLRFLKAKKNNTIFLHLVLTGDNIDNYKEVERLVNKIVYEITDCKIGIIVGNNSLNAVNLLSFINMLQNEVGEKWREVSKKISSLVSMRIEPKNVKEFFLNEGFKFDVNDSIFFFNYEFSDMSNFVTNMAKITNHDNYFSLFPLNGIKYPMFSYPKSGVSMVNTLTKINAKALILANSSNMKIINYYCNGLQNIISPQLSFAKTDDDFLLNQENVKAIIRDANYDLIIINYQIDSVKNVDELNKKLVKLDSILGYVHDFCIENKISLFISSLYGIQREIPVDNFTKAFVNFAGKVPFIVIDPIFNKTNFSLGIGNIYTLADTVYTNINNKHNGGEVLIKKKNPLLKMLKK